MQVTGVLYLVRHADAGDKRAWNGPDARRPLSDAGHRQAHELIAQFDGRAVRAIVSSPMLRCVQTVEPLARRRGIAVRTAAELGVDGDPDAAVARLLEGGAAHTVWCSHGELISEVLARLRARDAPLGDGAAWPKGSTWCLEVVDGSVVRAQYVAPPAT